MSHYNPTGRDRPGAQSFSNYASRFLEATFSTTPTHNDNDTPLFYSTQENWELGFNKSHQDDILGESDQGSVYATTSRRGRLSLDGESDSQDDGLGRESDDDDEYHHRQAGERSSTGNSSRKGKVEYPGSRLWEGSALPAFSKLVGGVVNKGWRAHESVAVPSTSAGTDVYREYAHDEQAEEDEYYEERDSLDSTTSEMMNPPSFLSPPPPMPIPGALPTSSSTLNEPLLPPKTIYVYPSKGRSASSRTTYQDSKWIVAYGVCVTLACIMGIRLWWTSSPSDGVPSLLPTIPILSLLSLLSLFAGVSSLFYLLTIRDAIRHLVHITLIGGPLILVGCGTVAWVGSFSNDGSAEQDHGWKVGVRWFGTGCWISAAILARMGLRRRKSVERTIKVLELSSSIIIDHKPLILLCLSLSVLSTTLTLPFLFVLAGVISDPLSTLPAHRHIFTWGSFAILLVYLWTLAILRGLQRVTVAGVVGSWYFQRNDPDHPGVIEVTRAAFARARGPSLGTIIASSFLVALFETTSVILRRLRSFLKSTSLPALLSPLTYLIPILSILNGLVEMFTSWVLSYAGLTGDDFSTSSGKVWKLLDKNGTNGLGANLLVKTILFISSFLWSTAAGVIAFLIASSKISDPKLAPILAILCFLVPVWTLKLCQGIVGDAADALFLAFNLDIEKSTSHCAKAVEAFGEPDSDSLA